MGMNIAKVLGYDWIKILRQRGWDHLVWIQACQSEDEDEIALAHPYNWMTEQEVNETGR